MLKRKRQWVRRDVIDFLSEKDFSFSETLESGSEIWIRLSKRGEPKFIVEVPPVRLFYSKKILGKMIQDSCLPEEAWDNWVRPQEE